ncbi:peptidyl-tRNA hydrolase, mitochondrial isoform X3 [Durio zibethinus]|uniref:Peptidyl-tRNA hydrolase, mitochondrial isoform X3 n=1 Tax=Durio zibethinus TaxID=66656 RepID=A0A6P5YU87_DURZI|nr:peptidyl-tRNA hydrolase, mitochondrial isoform X3 [Durio zibethinus]
MYGTLAYQVGLEMIDTFAEAQGIEMNTLNCKAIFGQGFVDDAPILLAKPQTYMNLSGESTGPLAAYYKLPLNRVIVFHDDMDLPCGVLRLQDKGGHGSHNGLKSIIYHFRGNREFVRLRIGIGRPPGQMDPKAFLLQKFNASARERFPVAHHCQTYLTGQISDGSGLAKYVKIKALWPACFVFNLAPANLIRHVEDIFCPSRLVLGLVLAVNAG